MSVQYRSSAAVTNGTAGTSVIVSKPSGTIDGDYLVAFIATAGTGTITAPAGWTLITPATTTANLRFAVYKKLAASEGSSWTWTLGASVRNWGVVVASTGVDPVAPVTATVSTTYAIGGTGFTPTVATLPLGGLVISGIAAIRAAGGSATTWTHTGTERQDVSTNAGAGTDIAGVVGTGVNTETDPFAGSTTATATMTGSQAQSEAIAWVVTLAPYFVPYAGGPLTVKVKASWGADGSDGFVFDGPNSDISADLLTPNGGLGPAVVITVGRPDQAGRSAPTKVQFSLKNVDGRYTPFLASGSNYPNVVLNTPIQIGLTGFGILDLYERALVWVDSWTPAWDTSLNISIVNVIASGAFQRLGRGDPQKSSMQSTIEGTSPDAYWTLEDGANANAAASGLTGGTPMTRLGGPTFETATGPDGAVSAIQFTTDTQLRGVVPPSAATSYRIEFAFQVGSLSGGATSNLLGWFTPGGTGAIDYWEVDANSTGLFIRWSGSGGVTNGSVTSTSVVDDDRWHHVRVDISQSGATSDVNVTLDSTLIIDSPLGPPGFHMVTSVLTNPGTSTPAALSHIAVWTPWVSGSDTFTAFTGYKDETPAARFTRLSNLEGGATAQVISGTTETHLGMGPAPVSRYLDGIAEVEDVDGGLIHDGGHLGQVVLVTRSSHYNAAATMTVDMDAFQLQPPFQPTLDSSGRRNSIRVTRPSGSSVRYVGDTSQGTYPDSISRNLGDDTHLYEVAGWESGVGSVNGLRYPALTINLRRTPALLQQWLATRLGSRIKAAVTAITQHPDTQPDVLLTGYTEELSSHWWVVQGTGPPFQPYVVGVLNSATLGRLSSSGMVLHADWNGVSGSFTVDTAAGALATTDPAEYPLDLNIDGQQVTVSACAGGSNPQTFTVSVASANGVSKTHTAGAQVTLWQPLKLAL